MTSTSTETTMPPHPAWQRTDLAPFGWAPGGYSGAACTACHARLPPHAKGAWRCAPCAAAVEWEAARADAALRAEYGPAPAP